MKKIRTLISAGLMALAGYLPMSCASFKPQPEKAPIQEYELSENLESKIAESLDNEIPVDPGFPPGCVSSIGWKFKNNFERFDIDIDVKKFDTSKNMYLQFYQSRIGDDGFYFGIQNRTVENDQMLIFSRWFNDTEIAKKLGIKKNVASMSYDDKVKFYRNYFRENPSTLRDYKEYVEEHVRINFKDQGFSQSATYEGPFVGVRLPGFELKEGGYIFSLIKGDDDSKGTWYDYVVTEKSTNTETWVGSIRFDKEAKINKSGSTWTELWGRPWPVQTYRHLPNWDVEIKSVEGDDKTPLHATSSYSDWKWGDHIPMEDVSYDSSENSIRMKLGPDVVRKNKAGKLY